MLQILTGNTTDPYCKLAITHWQLVEVLACETNLDEFNLFRARSSQ